MKNNRIVELSFNLAVQILDVGKYLKSIKEYEIAGQLIRSGTSIGANVEEAQGAMSKKDFYSKMSIEYKEARETNYWIKLIEAAKIDQPNNFGDLRTKGIEIAKILNTILKTMRSAEKR